jgi:hypothetical protein
MVSAQEYFTGSLPLSSGAIYALYKTLPGLSDGANRHLNIHEIFMTGS